MRQRSGGGSEERTRSGSREPGGAGGHCLRAASGRERRKCLNSCGGATGPGPRRAALATAQATGGLTTALLQFGPKPCSPGVCPVGATRGGLGPSWHRGARCHVQGRSGCGWVTCWHRESRTRRSCRVGAGSAQPRCQEGPRKATRRPEGPGSDVCGPEERMVTSSCACGSLAGTGAVSLLPRLLGCWPGGFCETPLLG